MTDRISSLAEDNKDVIVLSYLIRDYMRKTDSTNFTLADIEKNDTLGLITNNFSALEVDNWPNPWRGGYAVYYKFKDGRNKDSVKLTQYERTPWKVRMKKEIGRNDEQVAKKFDGEIHFYYPERFYHIREIIFKIPTH
ncbi:MAG: hypothetical protein O9262_03130 [Cyclobacteriaceae bacterium]|nr:hypothetical protein [Cyclobacteriaceae bacterium]